MLKKSLFALYMVVIAVMAVATIVEKYKGTAHVGEYWYGSWWFSALWALLTALAIVYFIRQRVRKFYAVVLHLSFVVILAGALLTHLTARQGVLHLRKGSTTDKYLVQKGNDIREHSLPFCISLKDFEVKYHEGTQAHADYVTKVFLDKKEDAMISMNKILSYKGFRLYQTSYDPDMQGSILAVNSDPWGIPVTYIGYAMLFIALIWMLFDPKGNYRKILREAVDEGQGSRGKNLGARGKNLGAMGKSLLLFFLLSFSLSSAKAAPQTIPAETAERLGMLYIDYNDRICPLQTFALDFTKKLYGKRYGKDADGNRYTAEQMLANFIFFGDEWERQPVIKVKSGPMKSTLQLPDYCSFSTFFNESMGGYILGPYVQEAGMGNRDKFHQDVMKIDDKLMMLIELRQGKLLKVFPVKYSVHTHDSLIQKTTWYAPTDKLPEDVETERKKYIENAFSLLYEYALAGSWDKMDEMLSKMLKYQQRYGTATLPTKTQTTAERIYNKIPFATILFMVCLTFGFLSILGQGKRNQQEKGKKSLSSLIYHLSFIILLLSFLALTYCMGLRWTISGTIPMSNGYETMLTMAWIVMLVALLMCRKFPIILTFGLLLAGFFLLVSHISQMDPQIGHLMPVLASPLLTIHVSVIMAAYALLSLTFFCGIWGLIQHKQANHSAILLSQLFLYPALTTLGLGIFIGAIWANVSWGTYWSWDPKETWALISFMVYAVPVHQQSIPWLRKDSHFHLYMVLAFLTLLMTYFGVNYFLGGLHSYA